jgi:hypothetical protein
MRPRFQSAVLKSRRAHSVQVVLVGISGRPCDNSRMVGKPEVILGLDLLGGQVVNALLYCVGLSEKTHHTGRCVIDKKFTSGV